MLKYGTKTLSKAFVSSETTGPAGPSDLKASLTNVLGLPRKVVDLILDTSYITGDERKPLFAIAKSKTDPTKWVYNNQEVTEIIRVWDLYKGVGTETGTENDPVKAPYSGLTVDATKIKSDDEAFALLSNYINGLVLNKERKAARDLLIPDDSVYEAPALAEYRREELLKINLLNRKKIPIKGMKCVRAGCGSDEIYKEEHFIRAGDEGGVWFSTCSKCGHFWKS